MEKSRLEQSILLDFYGELLTDKQRECYSLYYNEDLSLSEIAGQRGISRQGVWDNIRHAEKAMQAVENKTGLIARFEQTRAGLAELKTMIRELVPAEKAAAAIEKVDLLLDTL